MRKILLFIFMLTNFAAVSFAANYVPGEVIVRFKDPESTSRFQAKRARLSKIKSLRMVGSSPKASVLNSLSVVKLEDGASVEKAVEEYKKDPEVLYAEPNYYVEATARIPRDPRFSKLWGLNNTGQTEGVVDADIDAPEAWDLTTGSPNVIAAVIDTGIDYRHPDLFANMWQNPGEIAGNGIDDDQNGYIDDVFGYDFANQDSNPFDDNRHGTHVAGTIGAVGDNRNSVTGVAWTTRLMAVKFLDKNGRGTSANAVAAIRYAIDNGASVLNNSWGGTGYSQALQDIIDEAHLANVIVIAAAGNSNTDRPHYPAALNHVFAVAATDDEDKRAGFSNFGSYIDVAAPGVQIFSTLPGNKMGYLDGTSMASPHVAGVAVLIRSLHPEFTPDEVENIMRNSADRVTSVQIMSVGRINAFRAVQVKSPLPRTELSFSNMAMSPAAPTTRVTATALGPNLARWAFQYGLGRNPSTWRNKVSGVAPLNNTVLNNSLYGTQYPDGDLTFRLIAYDQNNQTSESRVWVKNNFGVAKMDDPSVQLKNGTRIVDLTGTAAGDKFASYMVEYRFFDEHFPSKPWTMIKSANVSVTNGVLSPRFDVGALAEGFYDLRLTVYDTLGGHLESVVRFRAGALIAEFPSGPMIYSGHPSDLIGTAVGTDLQSWRVELLAQTGPRLLSQGNTPVNNASLLHITDYSQFDLRGVYSLRLTVTGLNGATKVATRQAAFRKSIAEVYYGIDFVKGEGVEIPGSAVATDFSAYELQYSPTPSEGASWRTLLRSNTPVEVGNLAPNFVGRDVPDGAYGLRAMTFSQDGTTVNSVWVVFNVTTPPPLLNLVSPATLIAGAPATIKGTASGDFFKSYSLAYRLSGEANWTPLANSATAVRDGTLASFTPANLVPGTYELRLQVADTGGNTYEKITTFNLINARLTSPLSNDIYRRNEQIQVMARIGVPFRSYRVEVGLGREPATWTTRGISLVTTPPRTDADMLLARWDTSQAPTDPADPFDRFYRVRLIIETNTGSIITESHMVHLEERLRPGFPIKLPLMALNPGEAIPERDIKVEDLNGDNQKEVIVALQRSRNGVTPPQLVLYALRSNGGAVFARSYFSTGKFFARPVIANLDADSDKEILFAVPNPDVSGEVLIRKINPNATEEAGLWPLRCKATGVAMLVANLDNRGTPEIVVKREISTRNRREQWLSIYDPAGNLLNEFRLADEQFPADEKISPPVVGNFDADPDLEIVSSIDSRHLGIFNQNGTLVSGWPVEIPQTLTAMAPVVSDFNQNGTDDVVIVTNGTSSPTTSGHILSFDQQGKILWSVLGPADYPSFNQPAVADLDRDGKPELILTALHPVSGATYLTVLKNDGTATTGWPKSFVGRTTGSAATIGDVDGDGKPDIILPSVGLDASLFTRPSTAYTGGVVAFRSNGARIDLAPASSNQTQLFMETTLTQSIVVDDLDNDGAVELVAAAVQNMANDPQSLIEPVVVQRTPKNRFSVYVWSMGSAFSANAQQWTTVLGNNQQTGRFLTNSIPALVVAAPVNPSPARVTAVFSATSEPHLLGRNKFNPHRGEQGEIIHQMSSPGSVQLTIYDRFGQVVRVTPSVQLGTEPGIVTWDGRDDSGEIVAPGLYLVILDDGERKLRLKMIVSS